MEYHFNRFDQGKFGISEDFDAKKRKVAKWKYNLRREIANQPEYYLRHHSLRKHHERLLDMTTHKEIEALEPIVPALHCVKDNEYRRRAARQNQIDLQNAGLLARLRYIYTKDRSAEFSVDPANKCRLNPGKERISKAFRIAYENCILNQRIQEVKSTVESPLDHYHWYKEQEANILLKSKFPLYWNSRTSAPFERICGLKAAENPRPVVYLDIEVEDRTVGRVVMELRADLLPMTVENFRSTCASDRGVSYRCTKFSKVFPGLLYQGGYVGPHTSIFGESFPDENFKIKHDRPGIVSMVSYGKNTNNTEFRITACPLPLLDGRAVAIGQVISGMDFLHKVAKVSKPSRHGTPTYKIIVNDAGETTREEMHSLPIPLLFNNIKKQAEKAIAMAKKKRDMVRYDEINDDEEFSICSSYSEDSETEQFKFKDSESELGDDEKTAKEEDEGRDPEHDQEDSKKKKRKKSKKDSRKSSVKVEDPKEVKPPAAKHKGRSRRKKAEADDD